MKDRSDDPLHYEQTIVPQSYILFPPVEIVHKCHPLTPYLLDSVDNNLALNTPYMKGLTGVAQHIVMGGWLVL